MFAEQLSGTHTFAIRRHIPLDEDLTAHTDDGTLRTAAGEVVIAASPWAPDVPLTEAVSLIDAENARRRFVPFLGIEMSRSCFSCGLTDGSMGVHAAALGDGRFATDWTVPTWVDDPVTASGVLWAALDCTAAFYVCSSDEHRMAFTVQYAVNEARPVAPGERVALVGWNGDYPSTWDGRKRGACSAAFGVDGDIIASARSFWVSVDETQ